MSPTFDDLYSMSDLHLGGRPDAAVFDSSGPLAAFVRWAAARAAERDVALVIGGDIVDFLAFEGARHFNPTTARAWLESLGRDPAPTRVVFEALRDFTAAPKACLVLLAGNHDVELALPEVRETLLEMTGSGAAARARIVTRFDGTGFSCTVGGRTVVCVHGNERDDWNVIDHAALRRCVRDLNLHRTPTEFAANAGTRLVIDVMNPIKRVLPFVDLLKPEDEAVPNVLASLDKERRGLGLRDAVKQALGILWRKRKDARRMRRDELGANEPVDMREFRESFDADVGPSALVDVDRLYDDVENDFLAERAPLDMAGESTARLDALDTAGVLFGVRTSLRDALADIALADRGFDVTIPDATANDLDAWIGPNVDVLIAGHTHLEKHLPRARRPDGVYLNTGTWIRLIQLDPGHIADARKFAVLVDALTSSSMAGLDRAVVDGKPLVMRRRTVACVEHDVETKLVRAFLRHVRDDAVPADPFHALSPRPATELVAREEAGR